MYCNDPYSQCCRYHGQVVRIQDKSGREHIGRVSRVTEDRVYLDSPYDSRYGGYNDNYYGGWGFSIGLGFIAGIALAALFFI